MTKEQIISNYIGDTFNQSESASKVDVGRILELLDEGGFEILPKTTKQEWENACKESVRMWHEESGLRIAAEHKVDRAENMAEYERSRAVKAEYEIISKPNALKEALGKFCDAFDAGVVDIREARIIFGVLLGRDNLRDPKNSLGILLPDKT